MPYEVMVEGATLHKALSELKDGAGNVIGYDTVARVYRVGEIVPDEDLSPTIIQMHKDGDEHTTSLLKKVSGDPTTAEGGAMDNKEFVMGAQTGSPGVIKPDLAAELAERQTAAGEGNKPLHAGVSDKGAKKLEEEGFAPLSAMGKGTDTGAAVVRPEAGMSAAEAHAQTEAQNQPAQAEKKAESKSESKGSTPGPVKKGTSKSK